MSFIPHRCHEVGIQFQNLQSCITAIEKETNFRWNEKDNGIATYKKVCEQSKWKYPHMYRYLLCLPTKCKLQTVACSNSCIV